MQLEISKIIADFIENRISAKEFESWVYSNQHLEDELGMELYTELISINFKDSSARIAVKKLLDSEIDYRTLHRTQLIQLIEEIEFKKKDLLDGISELYEWADKGYAFLGRINSVGNFGEQGKSVVLIVDKELSNEEKWNVILRDDPHFLTDLKTIRLKIEQNEILITGEIETVKFLGRQYKYLEK
ncbi:hypothetical protein [uncultured Marivirga sp.]|uniref:hypothetical protein n=1 Tax=uncultured Marivirga sp. TaxID=1123707 RepID=UPI0030EE2E60|tara:strand:- start:754 stop:1311 length:558 start_codon:yes stop_codon:yes gene_type:complete